MQDSTPFDILDLFETEHFEIASGRIKQWPVNRGVESSIGDRLILTNKCLENIFPCEKKKGNRFA
jgi:hypothetical protein